MRQCMFCAGEKKAALPGSRSKASAKHSKHDPVAERSAKLLDEVENEASLIPERSMHQSEIRIETGL
jgi:hypothetical protein